MRKLETVFTPPLKLASPLPTLILLCIVAVVCCQADRLAYALGIPPSNIMSFWPASPLLAAVLLLTPRRNWPLLIAAGLAGIALADLKSGWPIGFDIWFWLGNLAEVLIVTLGIRGLSNRVPNLSSVNAFAKYLAFAVILAPLVSASLGANARVAGSYWLEWRVWYFADGLGFLTLTPAILTWFREGRAWARKPRNYLELAALMTLLVVFGYFAFMNTAPKESPALLYSLVPLLLWAALRLGLKGVSASIIVVALLAILGAAHDRGPFAGVGSLDNALSVQLFLFFAAIPFMFLAVLVEEQKQGQETLRASEERLQAIWNNSPASMFIKDRQGRYLDSNPRFSEKMSLPREQILGKIDDELFPPKQAATFRANERRILEENRPTECEEAVETENGIYASIVQKFPLRDAQGQPYAVCGIITDITERKLAEEALSTMSQKLIDAQEQERTRIARELHDDIEQRLAFLAVTLGRLKQYSHASGTELRQGIGEASKQVEDLVSDVQVLSHQLHSSKLEYLGLGPAAASLCQEISDRQGVKIDFHSENLPDDLPKDISLCLFRVLQEALQNAIKHSGSQAVQVSLVCGLGGIEVNVQDSGSGFDPAAAMRGRGIGLTSMKERLKLVNGRLLIDSKPQRGTTIQARVPLPPEMKSAAASGR